LKSTSPIAKRILPFAIIWAIGCLWLNGYGPFQDTSSLVDSLCFISGLILIVSGVALLIWGNIALFKSHGRDNTARIVLALLLGVWLWFHFDMGTSFRWTFFQRPGYEHKILQLQRLTPAQQDDYCKIDKCKVDTSHGVWRVYFVEYPGDMLGNDVGIVYDPSGKILQVNQKHKDGVASNDPSNGSSSPERVAIVPRR